MSKIETPEVPLERKGCGMQRDKEGKLESPRTIAQVIEDVRSRRWRDMPDIYRQSGNLPYIFELDPTDSTVERGIVLKTDEATGKILDEVSSIEEWRKNECYENGEIKEILTVVYDGTGKIIFVNHKKYDQRGKIIIE